MRSRTPSAKVIAAEIEKRLAYLHRRVAELAKSTNPQEQQMYHEMLGGLSELEDVRNMIAYRRRSLIGNSRGNDDTFPAVEVLLA